MLIIGIGALFAFLVFSPYVAGVLQAMPGTTFAGAVHYSLDYYYYLSYMAQGKFRWLTSFYPDSTETTTPVFYHWFYVLSGRVFSILGISNIIGYQILVLGLTVILLFVSYRLICAAIPSQRGRTTAFILFLASNAWPYLTHMGSGWTFGFFSSWYNYGEPFTRFSSIPHHLLAEIIVVGVLLFLVRTRRAPSSRIALTWTYFLLAGFLLASTQTPLVLVVVLTGAVFWMKDVISTHDQKMFPALVLLTAGAFPYTVYLRALLHNLPYSMFAGWEATQSVHLTLLQFFQVNGPVVLLGVLGLPLFLSGQNTTRRMSAVYTFLSWGIFFSPIPAYIAVLNIRFLSVIPTLTMACSAVMLIDYISGRFTSRVQAPLRIGIIIIVLALTLPATVAQMIARSSFDPRNGYLFLPDTVMDVNKRVESLVKTQEPCMVIWPFNISFAGLTGRRAFITTGSSTINYQAKKLQQDAFFSDTTPITQKMQILTSNGISCVVTYSFTKNLPPALRPVYTNSYMTIYRVAK